MKFSPDLLKAVDHCQHRSFITNKYNGARIAVDCGQCDYCIHKKAQKASMRVKTAGSSFKYSYFVTLTYDNEHVPLMACKVLHSDYDDALGISGDIHFGHEYHKYIPVSEYQCDDDSMLRHIFFEQVQGTVPFDREIKEYAPVKDNWFLSMAAIRSFIYKTQSVDKTDYPASEQYGRDNLIPFLNYVDVQNYIKRLRKYLYKQLGSYETLHFYAVGEYGPVHFRPHYHILLFTNSEEVSKVLRYCHDKSWKFGRSDFQIARGGSSSYVASYVNSLSSAQEAQILLNSDAQRVMNKYMDQNQQADLFIKAQTLVNLQTQGALTEKQIQTEIQRAILASAEASGKKIDNRVASETANSLIKAANASNELQYRDSTYDYKNVKLRKHTEYKTSMANQKAAEYGADLVRKQTRTHYWDSVSRGLGAVAAGAGNVIGAGSRLGFPH
jgi:hypothetical protein